MSASTSWMCCARKPSAWTTLTQRQLKYAEYAWQPPDQGRRAPSRRAGLTRAQTANGLRCG